MRKKMSQETVKVKPLFRDKLKNHDVKHDSEFWLQTGSIIKNASSKLSVRYASF